MPSNILVSFATEISFAKMLVPSKTKTYKSSLHFYNIVMLLLFARVQQMILSTLTVHIHEIDRVVSLRKMAS